MVSAPSTAAVSVGTAITAASRQRTRQLARANRDRAEAGFLGCGWVARTMLAAGGAPGGVWVVRGAPALPCSPACRSGRDRSLPGDGLRTRARRVPSAVARSASSR